MDWSDVVADFNLGQDAPEQGTDGFLAETTVLGHGTYVFAAIDLRGVTGRIDVVMETSGLGSKKAWVVTQIGELTLSEVFGRSMAALLTRWVAQKWLAKQRATAIEDGHSLIAEWQDERIEPVRGQAAAWFFNDETLVEVEPSPEDEAERIMRAGVRARA